MWVPSAKCSKLGVDIHWQSAIQAKTLVRMVVGLYTDDVNEYVKNSSI